MASWAAWIAAGLSGWVIKAAVSLGFGVVVYLGWDVIKAQVDAAVAGSLANVSGSIYSLLSLGGFIDAVGIWLGAMTVAVTLLAFKKFAFIGS